MDPIKFAKYSEVVVGVLAFSAIVLGKVFAIEWGDVGGLLWLACGVVIPRVSDVLKPKEKAVTDGAGE